MTVKLGELGDALYAKKQEIAAANEVVKRLDAEAREIEDELLIRMQDVGTDIVRGSSATISISENIRPQLQDLDSFSAFVQRKKALHLFERRISTTAYREMKEALGNKPVPGVTEFTQLRLNVRKL